MNKYQEALNKIKNYEFKKNSWVYDIGARITPETDILQELVDKETPMKPTLRIDEKFNLKEYFCPICNKESVTINNYYPLDRCEICGQRIDWSKDE